MTEEEINALVTAKAEAEAKASEALRIAEEARAAAEKAKADLGGVVNELTEERRKKQEAIDKANITNPQSVDVSTLVEKALQEKESQRKQSEITEAIAEFKSSKPEFQNDAAGIVFEKFKNELNKFNLSDIRNKAEATARLNEIYRFVNFRGGEGQGMDYDGSPSSGYTVPTSERQTPKELDSAMKSVGMDETKFKKLQEKYPDALNGLGISG